MVSNKRCQLELFIIRYEFSKMKITGTYGII
jgi:hypothetical protein